MINRLQTRIYPALRKSVCLTQNELAATAGISRGKIQAIENGSKLPTEEEETAIRAATHSTLLLVAEALLCEEMTAIIGHPVAIRSEEKGRYQAATADGRMNQLLLAAQPIMPEDRWWAWKERESRRQALGQIYEHEGYANVRDLKSEVEALQAEKETAGKPE